MHSKSVILDRTGLMKYSAEVHFQVMQYWAKVHTQVHCELNLQDWTGLD